MERVLAELGGLESFVKPGQAVLIKPNLLTDRSPDEAVTTHPDVVRCLARMVRDCGGTPSVADSPANVVKIERVWQKTGFLSMCKEEDVPLVNLEKAGSVKFREGKHSFSIARPVLDADVVINVPKIKTHSLTVLTGAVKNMYGTVPGFQKANLHKLNPRPQDFGKIVAAIYRNVPPTLSLADAVVGMDGDGPSAGRPLQLGFLAASTDAVSLDLALCNILRIRPRSVPYLRHLAAEEDWTLSSIEIVGDDLADVSPAAFGVPSTFLLNLVPEPLVRLLQPFIWIRPGVLDTCVSCGRCVKACPVQALTMAKGEKPVLDPPACIGCCCCHEVCPESAVQMVQSPLLNMIRRGKLE